MGHAFDLHRFQNERLYRYFKRFLDPESCTNVLGAIKSSKQAAPTCPHCDHYNVVRYGKYRDRQRYKCKECSRTFNDFTNTPLHRTHYPEKWIKFVECMIQGRPLQWTAYSVGITYVTAFYWRQKLIKVMQMLEGLTSGDIDTALFPFVCVKQNPPIDHVHPMERNEFSQWIRTFDWIARKYVNRYIAWFHQVKGLDFRHFTLEDIKMILLNACSVSMNQTYRSIQLA